MYKYFVLISIETYYCRTTLVVLEARYSCTVSVVCQIQPWIQRFDFDCILVVSRKVII